MHYLQNNLKIYHSPFGFIFYFTEASYSKVNNSPWLIFTHFLSSLTFTVTNFVGALLSLSFSENTTFYAINFTPFLGGCSFYRSDKFVYLPLSILLVKFGFKGWKFSGK